MHRRFRSQKLTANYDSIFIPFGSTEVQRVRGDDAEADAPSEVDETDDTIDATRARVKAFEECLAREPKNVDLWLAYSHAHCSTPPTPAELEISRSILDRGIQKIAGPPAVALHIGRLLAISSYDAPRRTEREWRQFLDLAVQWARDESALGDSLFVVWQEYLRWVESLPSDGIRTIGTVLEAYEAAIITLQRLSQSAHSCFEIPLLIAIRIHGWHDARVASMLGLWSALLLPSSRWLRGEGDRDRSSTIRIVSPTRCRD